MNPAGKGALWASLATPLFAPIGRSVLGRPILARSWPGAGPAVLLLGAIHGDEPLGAFCLAFLARELDLLRQLPRAVWMIPVANPDGFLAGRQNNVHLVDLNRNFPAKNWGPAHRPRHFPGTRAASEPETRALMAAIESSRATRLIALHSPFRTVNYDGPARALAERMAQRNGYGASADIGYPTPGSLGSLYGVDQGHEVITLEIPPMSPQAAWRENRLALYGALDIDFSALHGP